MRSFVLALPVVGLSMAAEAASVVVMAAPQVVVVPAPTVSVATRVTCRPATFEDFAPDLRQVNGVSILSPQRGAFASGRCSTETTTTVTRPIR